MAIRTVNVEPNWQNLAAFYREVLVDALRTAESVSSGAESDWLDTALDVIIYARSQGEVVFG